MARKGFGCERPECASCTDINGEASFGTGGLTRDGFWEFPCEECRNALKLQEKWQQDKPITCDNGHKMSIKEWHAKGCPKCLEAKGSLEITQTARSTVYDILCHNCGWTTMAIRPVNSEFICAKCGAHENIGEIIHSHMWKEMWGEEEQTMKDSNGLAEELVKKLKDPNLPRSYTMDDFFDGANVPGDCRTDSAFCVIINRAFEISTEEEIV